MSLRNLKHSPLGECSSHIKLNRECYKRERRKIKKLSKEVLTEQYKGWRGNIIREFGITNQLKILDNMVKAKINICYNNIN